MPDGKLSYSSNSSRRSWNSDSTAEKYDWTTMHVIQYPPSAFCSRTEHNHRRQCSSRLSSSSSSSSDAAMPAKCAVVDRLLTSQLPNEIMIMNTMAHGEWPTIRHRQLPVHHGGGVSRIDTDANCMHLDDIQQKRSQTTKTHCVMSG